MPFYTYICDVCRNEWGEFRLLQDFSPTVSCGKCGGKSHPKIYPPIINTDPHRWDLKPDPTRPGVMMNEKAEVHYVDEVVDSEGNVAADIPIMDCPEDLPAEDLVKMAPQIKVGKGEKHPTEFVPDMARTVSERRDIIRKGT